MVKKNKNSSEIIIILGLVSLGVIIGMLLAFSLLYFFTDNLVSNILESIQIENINFDLNETAMVEAMNNTFGGLNGKS